MKLLRSPKQLNRELRRPCPRPVGFIPTMGGLHEGHLELIRRARRECASVVVSIFVNPLQFGPGEDFKRYPRNLARDARALRAARADVLYAPAEAAFYGPSFQTPVGVGPLSRPLCGKTRPAHFAGVATVVLKLLNQVRPDRLYLGMKDYQQVRVIEQMIADLDLGVKVVRVPTVREKDGLAMSSRNVFLSPAERIKARLLAAALKEGEARVREGWTDVNRIKTQMKKVLRGISGRLDYLEIVDSRSLEPVVKLTQRSSLLIAIAWFFGRARLIDSRLIKA